MFESLSPEQRKRIDELRGIAIFAVLVSHVSIYRQPRTLDFTGIFQILRSLGFFGFAGADLFFVISGFLIARQLLIASSTRQPMSHFYFRRLTRLFPAYWFIVLAMVPVAGWTRSSTHALLMLGNLSGVTHVAFFLIPLWTLCLEFQFYLVAPFWIRWSSKQFVFYSALTICILSPILRESFGLFPAPEFPPTYFLPWFRLDGLAAGVALGAFELNSARDLIRKFRLPFLLGFLGLVVFLPQIFDYRSRVGIGLTNSVWTFFFSYFLALKLLDPVPSFQMAGGRVSSFLQAMGRGCYELYLLNALSLGIWYRYYMFSELTVTHRALQALSTAVVPLLFFQIFHSWNQKLRRRILALD